MADSYSATEHEYGLPQAQISDNDGGGPQGDPDDFDTEIQRLWERYFGDQEVGASSWRGAATIDESLHSLGLSLDSSINPKEADEKFNAAKHEMVELYLRTRAAGGAQNPRREFMLMSIFHKLMAIKNIIQSIIQLNCAETSMTSNFSAADATVWPFLEKGMRSEDMTDFQKALMWVCNDISSMGLRKSKSHELMRRKFITDPENPDYVYPTCFWEVYCTIEEYCSSLTGYRTLQQELWMWLTSSTSGSSNIKALQNHLIKAYEIDIPPITSDKSIFSFQNGVYNCREERFVSYSDQVAMRDVIDKWVACNHFDLAFNQAWLEEDDPMKIATPTLDKCMDTQRWSEDVKRWFLVMTGRLLYKTKELDDWQVVLFLKGNAGTGKSLLLEFIRTIYNPDDVAYIQNNVESKFGLSDTAGKYVAICDDIKKDFKMDQSDFQNAVSGITLSMPVKHSAPIKRAYDTPMIMSGNELPGFQDNMGSVARRILAFLFAFVVKQPDSRMQKWLDEERAAFICKANRTYRNMLRRYPNLGSVWKVLPEELQKIREETASNRNALQGAIHSDEIQFAKEGVDEDDSVYMPLDSLRALVVKYAKDYGMQMPQWTPDYYKIPLMNLGLRIESSKLPYPRNTPPKQYQRNRQIIFGIDLAQSYEMASRRRDMNEIVDKGMGSQLNVNPPPEKRARLVK